MKVVSGVVLTAACQEDQCGYDIRKLGNALFCYYYIGQGMLHKLGDGNNGGMVTVEEAFAYAAQLVRHVPLPLRVLQIHLWTIDI